MHERFTDRARKVMQLANQEAQRFNHEYIGTEHILLGLVKEGSGVAANVLKNLDISGVAVPDGNGAGVRYDQGTLTSEEWDSLDAYEEKAYGVLSQRGKERKVSA